MFSSIFFQKYNLKKEIANHEKESNELETEIDYESSSKNSNDIENSFMNEALKLENMH